MLRLQAFVPDPSPCHVPCITRREPNRDHGIDPTSADGYKCNEFRCDTSVRIGMRRAAAN
ncbi:MAG: hypothetical protein OIF47_07980 [Marinibacterium sp.]|nr:hypothetical protein [Marinibacterium sp.]